MNQALPTRASRVTLATQATMAAWASGAALQLLSTPPALAQTSPQAQTRPPPAQAQPQANAPSQRAEDVDLSVLLRGATQIAQLIDAGQAADLWNNASPAVRPKLSTAQFVTNLQQRLALGKAQSRKWVQTQTINATPGSGAPPGRYASIEFIATFSGGQTLNELISLRQDEDQIWRFVGYGNP